MNRVPAEWEPHDAVWLAWPSHLDLWGDKLTAAQDEFVALCRGIRPTGMEGERLEILARTREDEEAITARLKELRPRIHRMSYGDIWLRDTAPVFAQGPVGLLANRFRFNGWGGKYELGGDRDVAPFVAESAGAIRLDHPITAEGGALEFDGEGTVLTTRSCLLNPNRTTQSEAELGTALREALGAERIVWLDGALENDHTDGHIDTLARFVAPGTVVCMEPAGADDPNRATLARFTDQLNAARDAAGRRLRVHTVPSPGCVTDATGEVMPASYVNFYVANSTVVVPTYGVPNDAVAVSRIAALFPGRRTVGASARALLHGGGAFHCITQQQPRSS
ncbi:MAG: agmatine deiminase family protein [Myxococcota bacterium]